MVSQFEKNRIYVHNYSHNVLPHNNCNRIKKIVKVLSLTH